MAVALATIGSPLVTSLSRPGMGKDSTVELSAPPLANSSLNGLSDQMVTTAVRIRNGDHALITWPME